MTQEVTEAHLQAFVKRLEANGGEFACGYVDAVEQKYGIFYPPPTGPLIRIYRPRSEQVGNDWEPTAEQMKDALLTAEHEYGHFLSWKADPDRWKVVHDATYLRHLLRNLGESVADGMPAEARRLILDEEELAWQLGRAEIPEWLKGDYDALRDLRLDGYRQELFPGAG